MSFRLGKSDSAYSDKEYHDLLEEILTMEQPLKEHPFSVERGMYYVVEKSLAKFRQMYPPLKSSNEKSDKRSKYSAYFNEFPFVEYSLRVVIFEDERGSLFHYFGQPSSINHKAFSRKPKSNEEYVEVLESIKACFNRVAQEKASLPENIQRSPDMSVPNKRVKFNPEPVINFGSDDLNEWLNIA